MALQNRIAELLILLMTNKRQPQLLAEAKRHMPQGVAENYRYWGDDRTVFIEHAKGCTLTDCDGKTYVDFRLGYGPIILGYRDDRVDQAVVARSQVLQLNSMQKWSSKSKPCALM